jgi:hypothetical protein
MLRRLVRREAVSILYTHLGKVQRRGEPLALSTQGALRRLARWHRDGHILVTTTRRVLDYRRMSQNLKISAMEGSGGLQIRVTTHEGSTDPARELAGLTLYVPHTGQVRLNVDGRDLPTIERNAPDHTGRPSVSIPWVPLEFPRP